MSTVPTTGAGSAPTIHVCVTCRASGADPSAPERPGAELVAALRRQDPAAAVVPVECLSVCRRPCTVAFSAPGKWTYIYADLPAATAAGTILEGARLYAEAPDGIIPWKIRPDALKRGVVARLPPFPAPVSDAA